MVTYVLLSKKSERSVPICYLSLNYRVRGCAANALSLSSERVAVRGGESGTGLVPTVAGSRVDVVLPSGIVLRRDVPAEEALRGLSPGLYIVAPR